MWKIILIVMVFNLITGLLVEKVKTWIEERF